MSVPRLTKDEAYWQKRNEDLEAEWFRRSQKEIEKEVIAYYAQALRHIEKDINDLYTRFSIDNSMNMVAAQRLLQGEEYRTWRMDMKEYLDSIEKTGDKKLLLELNTLAMRSRVSRLDKLRAETYVEFSKLAEKFGRSMDKFLPSAYKDFYYRNLFEIGKKRGLDATPVKVDSKEMEKILRTPWSGKNYSERIWANQERLGKVICNEIASAMHRGSSVEKTSQIVAQKMNVGIHDAKRLVRTELNYVQNRAALDSIRDSGMKYYRFIATLDKRTSTVCRAHDGKIYPVEDGSPGTNMPPLHPHCRSTIAGSLNGDSSNKGQRAAIGQDGKTCKVPSNMSYRDWETVYLKKDIALDQWKEIHEKFTHHDLEHGIIQVNKAVIKSTPHDVHVVIAAKGGKTWNFYDSNGWIYLQVSDNAHGHKKEASFGRHGEHAHFYTEMKNGIPQHGTAVEVPSFVRKALGDDL